MHLPGTRAGRTAERADRVRELLWADCAGGTAASTSAMSVSRRYRKRLADYLRFTAGAGALFRPEGFVEGDGPSAELAMRRWESEGIALPLVVRGADRLARYVQGKRSRDWHVSEWRAGIASGLLHPTELVGTFGLTAAEVLKLVSDLEGAWHGDGPFRPQSTTGAAGDISVPSGDVRGSSGH